MSRTRSRAHQHDLPLQEQRASPLHWSDHSDDYSSDDQEKDDGTKHSPPHIVDYEAEQYDNYESSERNQYHKASGRSVVKHGAATERYRTYRRSCETDHPEDLSKEYKAEDPEQNADFYGYGRGSRNQYQQAPRSPVSNRRPMEQYGAATEKYWTPRGSGEIYHAENYFPKVENDRQSEHDNKLRPKAYVPQRTVQNMQVKVKDSINYTKSVLVVAFITVVGLLFRNFIEIPSEENNFTGGADMMTTIKNALSRFDNIPEDVVFQLSAGIRSILESNPNRPSIFVLLHNNTGEGPFCLANSIGTIAMKYLESDEASPLILKPDELLKNENISQDYGWIIEDYKPYVEKHRSVIVSDLQKFPGRMAMAFHFFCDIYSPIVPKSLFVFTLHVANVYNKKKVEQAETAMHNIWKHEVDDDQRQALITRLTEDIITLPANILHEKTCP